MTLQEKIIEMLENEENYNNIFNLTHCTKVQFLDAVNKHHNDYEKTNGILYYNEVYTRHDGIIKIKNTLGGH